MMAACHVETPLKGLCPPSCLLAFTSPVSSHSSPMQNVLKKVHKVSKPESQLSLGGQRCVGELDEELAGAFPLFIRNAVLGQKQPNRTTAESRCSTDVVRIGFDGLGGRTKFIQPRDTTIIRPVPVKSKAKSKQKVRIKTVSSASQPKLDTFLCQ